MRIPMNVKTQYDRTRGDDLRILVVGAGIAGATVAQLLRRAGRHPVLVDRASDDAHPGYMIALMPMADPALRDLGAREDYHAASVALTRYALRTRTGEPRRDDPLANVLGRYGDYRGIGRGELMAAITTSGCDVAYGTTVTALDTSSHGCAVTFSAAGESHLLEFDVVIVADGIRSATRRLLHGDASPDVVDTGWAGWVVWAPDDADTGLGEEIWGAGFFLGAYPVLGRVGAFLGGPADDLAAGPAEFAGRVRRALRTTSPRVDSVLGAVATQPDPYLWPMTDARAPRWAAGTGVLLGDAAAGFLPTAGIGAAMAMESAWMLAAMLRDARPDTAASLLRAYESAQRPRVEAAQDMSRRLAGLMFRRGTALAVVRDAAMRVVSADRALRPVQRLLENGPDPAAAIAASGSGSAPSKR